MPSELCLGRDCKLGWRYNEALNLLIPTKEAYQDNKSKVNNKWEYFVYSLSKDNIPHSVGFYVINKSTMNVSDIHKSLL